MEQLIHEPSRHREWNESYYYVWCDRENDVKAMARLGFKPNKDEGSTFFLVFLPDGSVAGYRATEGISGEWGRHSLTGKGMSFEPRRDGSWRYRFRGDMVQVRDPADFPRVRDNPALIAGVLPAEMDMVFRPHSEAYEYSEHMTPESLELGKSSGDQHWEQIGIVGGTLRVGEHRFTVRDQLGQRDHTHGVRDWTGVGNWFYYVVWFSKSLAVNPAAIVADDGRVSFGGFLFRDGRNIPIKGLRVLSQEFVGGVIPVSSELEILDADSETHILRGRAGPTVPLSFTEGGRVSVLAQSFGEFELDGVRGGYGSFETLRVAPRSV